MHAQLRFDIQKIIDRPLIKLISKRNSSKLRGQKILTQRYVGCVDHLSSQHISGWIFNQDNIDEEIIIEIVYNNIVIGKLLANLEREDVEKIYGKKNCGFSTYLSGMNFFFNYKDYQFRVRGSNFFFGYPSMPREKLASELNWRKHGVISVLSNSTSFSKKVAIIAMFSNDETLSKSQIFCVNSYRALGYTVVAVMATDRNPTLVHVSLAQYADYIILRNNFGWDFSSWAAALDLFSENIQGVDEIILTNDSIIGPSPSLAADITRMQAKNLDFWGITDCWQHSYHIQSYFMYFNKSSHSNIIRFFDNYKPSGDKEYAIQNGEIYLSQYMIKSNLRHGVLCPYEIASKFAIEYFCKEFGATSKFPEFISSKDSPFPVALSNLEYRNMFFADAITAIRNRTPLNPTHHFWYVLMSDMKTPFLKKELVGKNPVGVPDLYNIDNILLMDEYSQFSILLRDYLMRDAKSLAIWMSRQTGDFE
ncbi:rhamnan synthesis F family protein [Asticcacaulis sp.]|uniref:rhamnan synthesis F family protein n=1 Tax=Asticcacaulis sp. TaxID=1872648 RepID=UPI002614234B|nr:rhamnan synthesis F family protein [Asticcacaulis sp.]